MFIRIGGSIGLQLQLQQQQQQPQEQQGAKPFVSGRSIMQRKNSQGWCGTEIEVAAFVVWDVWELWVPATFYYCCSPVTHRRSTSEYVRRMPWYYEYLCLCRLTPFMVVLASGMDSRVL